jgi:glycyl-tRNA synthetase (class II)
MFSSAPNRHYLTLCRRPVSRASGHVERFTDVMVKDLKNGECIRADHLLEDVMEGRMKDAKLSKEERDEAQRHHEQAGNYTKEELKDLYTKCVCREYLRRTCSELSYSVC